MMLLAWIIVSLMTGAPAPEHPKEGPRIELPAPQGPEFPCKPERTTCS